MIEIDVGSLQKAKTKQRVWVKPTAKKVGYYRMQEVGRKEIEKVEKSYLYSKFENRFGIENMDKYSESISSKSDEELIDEFSNLMANDKEFAEEFVKEWLRGGMWKNDGWITKELKLSKKNSRWNIALQGESKTPGESDSFMKFYLLNQEQLKRKFPDDIITIYRGLSGDVANELLKNNVVDIKDNNLSCWTEIYDIAELFASLKIGRGVVLETKVPIKDVLMTSRLVRAYEASYDPTELILIRSKNESKVISSKEYEDKLDLDEVRVKANNKWGEIK
jgi:hypothetical protein